MGAEVVTQYHTNTRSQGTSSRQVKRAHGGGVDSWRQHKQIGWVLVTPAVLRPGGAQLLLDYKVSCFPEQPASVPAREGNRLNIGGRGVRDPCPQEFIEKVPFCWRREVPPTAVCTGTQAPCFCLKSSPGV